MGRTGSYELSVGITHRLQSHSRSVSGSFSFSIGLCISVHLFLSLLTIPAASSLQPGPAASRWLPSNSARMSSSISITLQVSGRQVREEDYRRTGSVPR